MMRRFDAALLSAAALLAPFAAPAQRQPDVAAPLATLDAYVAKAVTDWNVPGLAIAVVKDGSVAFSRGYGVRTIGTQDAVDTHTLFANASTTKAFTALAMAMLVDAGKVRWDDPVAAHVPGFVLRDPYVTRELTIRDLLTHELGFGDPDYLWYGHESDRTLADMIRRLRWVPPQTSLRSHFAYNNVGYAIAGLVESNAAGTTWQELVRSRILRPLGMTETLMGGVELAGKTNVARPHAYKDDTLRVMPASSQELVDPIAPAGSMYSNVTDMAKWMRFLLDSARVGNTRLVSDTAFAELFKPQVLVGPDEFYPTAKLTKPSFTAYGMAWFLEDYRGEKVAFHTGSIDGTVAIVGLIPARRLGVVVFANRDHPEVRHALMYRVFDAYLGGPQRDWSADMRVMYQASADSAKSRERRTLAKRVLGTKPTLPLDRYTGTYTDSLHGATTVRLENGHLVVAPSEFLTADLEHWNYDTFRAHYRNWWLGTSMVTFRLGADGSVSGVDLGDGALLNRVEDKKPNATSQ